MMQVRRAKVLRLGKLVCVFSFYRFLYFLKDRTRYVFWDREDCVESFKVFQSVV